MEILKKIISLLLIIVVIITLVACQGVHDTTHWKIENDTLIINGVDSIGDFCNDRTGYGGTECFDPTCIPWYGKEYKTIDIGSDIKYISAHSFADSQNLEKVFIDGEDVHVECGAFSGCKNLKDIINAFNITCVESYGFYDCKSLEIFSFGEKLTSIERFAFSGCTNLKEVYIPKSVENIGEGAFAACTSLEKIEVDEDNPNYISHDGVLYSKDMDTLVCYPSGKKDVSFTVPEQVSWIQDFAFGNCEYLEEITLKDVSVGYSAFMICRVLKTANIEGDVRFDDNALLYCESLEKFMVSEDHPTYSSVDGVLYNSNKDTLLRYPPGRKNKSFTIPGKVVKIEEDAFEDVVALENINFERNNITAIDPKAFRNCKSLKSIEIPESVTEICEDAFYLCESLESVTIPESVTAIRYCAFGFCSSLESINIPADVTGIGDSVFRGCSSLKKINISEGVRFLGNYAFTDCTSLKSIEIPESIETIGEDAFANIDGLTIICKENSVAHTYAKTYGISCEFK